jgi:tetratricopeptide (TPR) repeat protein
LEKAIEIKRRAQRCILNGDLDGALNEYEKLVASGDSDPYHSVLLADLLYKKGDHKGAAKRYLEAVDGYERSGLVKNAIAVCKKMSRLALEPPAVLLRLAGLHALDGLATESSLYYMQHAELMIGSARAQGAMDSLRLAFQVCPDNVKALERLAEVQNEAGALEDAAQTLLEAASHYTRLGQVLDSGRCESRAEQMAPGVSSRPRSARPAEVVPPSEANGDAPDSEPEARGPAAVAEDRIDADGGNAPPSADGAPPVAATAGPAAVSLSPAPPGLMLDLPGGEESSAAEEPEDAGLPEVSRILAEAQGLFQDGQHEEASAALVRAAQAYDRIGRFENAASIYRSLSQATEVPLQVMMLWLKNCQRRDDPSEAARVACELGDRALKDGDRAGAREWFERAKAYDAGNELAERRLKRLAEPEGGTVATAEGGEEAAAAVAGEAVETVSPDPGAGGQPHRSPADIAVIHDDPMNFDLGTLIRDFQQGLEDQLASDAQAHYDLGMSYREMGLLAEALHSFEVSGRDPAFRVRASEMKGRCLQDQGDFDLAAEQFQLALEMEDLPPGSVVDIRYQLGLALEAGGRAEEARREFERVYADAPSYPHVASKIRALRNAQERE